MDPMSFFSGTVFGVLLLYLARALFEHSLAKDLSASDRKAAAAIEFRTKMHQAIALLPSANETWKLHTRSTRSISEFIPIVDLAVKNFSAFLSRSDSTRLTQKWEETKNHCQTTLPRSMKDGDNNNVARDHLLNSIDEILSYAKET